MKEVISYKSKSLGYRAVGGAGAYTNIHGVMSG